MKPLLVVFLRRRLIARHAGDLRPFYPHAYVRRDFEGQHLVADLMNPSDNSAGRHHFVVALEPAQHLRLLLRLLVLRPEDQEVHDGDDHRQHGPRSRHQLLHNRWSVGRSGRCRLRPCGTFEQHQFTSLAIDKTYSHWSFSHWSSRRRPYPKP